MIEYSKLCDRIILFLKRNILKFKSIFLYKNVCLYDYSSNVYSSYVVEIVYTLLIRGRIYCGMFVK